MTPWRALLALALGFLALHNLEELVTAPAYVDRLLGGFDLVLPRGRTVGISAEVYASLAWATLLPALLLAWAAFERAPGKGAFAAAWLEVVLLVNALLPHAAASIARRAYTPGVLSAVLVNIPFGVVFLRRARAGGRISGRALRWAVGLGIALYPIAIVAIYILGHLSLAALAAAGLLG